jgi:nucleotide-binding universal stress UspA family protein
VAFVPGPVLLCVDGSPGALRALETAGALVGGAALAVCVWEPIGELSRTNPWGAFVSAIGRPAQELDEIAIGVARDVSEEAAQAARAAGFADVQPLALRSDGAISATLLAVAEERDARVVVAGSRGLGRVTATLLGSVSHALVQQARRPILIVPPPPEAEDPA